MPIQITSLLFGCALLGAAAVGYLLPKHETWWKTIPRARYGGTVLGFIGIGWAVGLAGPMVQGLLGGKQDGFLVRSFANSPLLPLLLVCLITAGCYFLMDYLLARALGGLILLAANLLLQQAFAIALAVPQRVSLAAVCYILGTYALFMLGTPYRFRNLLERMTQKPAWRLSICGGLTVGGLFVCSLALRSYG